MQPRFRPWTAIAALIALAATVFVASAQAAPRITHGTPKVPVVVDGVRYQPEGIHKFDGKPLYLVVDLAKPDELVGFTREADFKATVTAKTKAYKERIGATTFGQHAIYFSGDERRGESLRVDSGWGVNDLRGVLRGCGIFGCAGDWNDVISSVEIHGHQYLYRDAGYGGGYFWAVGDGWFNMSTYGFDNIGSSLNVWF